MIYRIEKVCQEPLIFIVYPMRERDVATPARRRFQVAAYLTQRYFDTHGHKGPGLAVFILTLERALNELSIESRQNSSADIEL